MIKFALAAAAALMIAPVFGGTTPARAGDGPIAAMRMAQVDVEVGRDRDRYYDHDRWERRHRDFTVGVGPGGVHVGPGERCRTVTTWIDRPDGRRIRRTERRCD